MSNLDELFDLIDKKYYGVERQILQLESDEEEVEFLDKIVNIAHSNNNGISLSADIEALFKLKVNDFFLALVCSFNNRGNLSFNDLKEMVDLLKPQNFNLLTLSSNVDTVSANIQINKVREKYGPELFFISEVLNGVKNTIPENILLSIFANFFKTEVHDENDQHDLKNIRYDQKDFPKIDFNLLSKMFQKLGIDDDGLIPFFKLLTNDCENFINSIIIANVLNYAVITIPSSTIDLIQSRIDKLNNDNIEKLKSAKAKLKRKEKIISEIQSQFSKEKVQIPKDFLILIDDDEINFSLLKKAVEHNLINHLAVEKELDIENAISDLEKMFKTYKFDFNKLSKEQEEKILKNVNLDSCNKILQSFSGNAFSNIREKISIYDILMYSSPENVSCVCRAFSANSICEDFIIKNPGIFISSSDDNKDYEVVALFDDFSKNVDLLRKKKINTYSISEDDEQILLQDYEKSKEIVSLLNSYNLNLSNLTTFDILSDKGLIHNIDLLIELGLGDYVRENPNVICEDSTTLIKRAQICKMLGIPLIVDNQLNPKLKSRVFTIGNNIISNDNMDNYIDTSVLYTMNEDMFKELKNTDITVPASADILKDFAISKSEYSFDGITVSRQRFLRNYTILKNSERIFDENEMIINSIIYGSLLSIDDVNNISTRLCDKGLIKKKVDD